jgi:hypothetical protein
MKIFWWKLRFVIIIMFRSMVSWDFAWQIADSWVESFGVDSSTPSEAVDDELSCWGD